jgi:hypothetical protein
MFVKEYATLQNFETFVFGYLNVDRPVLTEAVVGFIFWTEFSQKFHVVMFWKVSRGFKEDCSILGKELPGCYGHIKCTYEKGIYFMYWTNVPSLRSKNTAIFL